LLSNSFSHIVNAIEEGRGIYDNIQKTIMHLMSGNLSEVLIVVLAVILGWDLPLTVIMILWINLVSDGAPALALAIDPYGKNIMQRPPRRSNEGIMTAKQTYFVVLLALVTTIYALVLFNNYTQNSLIMAQTMVFNVIIVAEIGLLFAIRFLFETPLRSNVWLWVTVIMTLLLQVIIMYTPISQVFSVASLDSISLSWVISAGLLVFILGVLLSYKCRNKSTQNNS
jgi:Ca2+-transporting ATPase